MRNEYVINKLVSNLGRLSDQELQELSNLFYEGDVAKAFAEVVEKIIYLRRAERQRSKKFFSTEANIPQRAERDRHISSGEPARDKFFVILNDRSLFPATRDVVEVLNNVFGLELQYENYRKRGRRDLIKKCWHHFEKMPIDKRRRVIQLLSNRSAHGTFRSEGYHELFRILSQK